jgi:hypothetical protein
MSDTLRSPSSATTSAEASNSRTGVSKEEAQVLANQYFHSRFGACGVTAFIGEDETHWLFEVYAGIASIDEGTVYINKHNGVVSFKSK